MQNPIESLRVLSQDVPNRVSRSPLSSAHIWEQLARGRAAHAARRARGNYGHFAVVPQSLTANRNVESPARAA